MMYFIFSKKICAVALFFLLRVALEVERCLRRSKLFMVFGYLVLNFLGNFLLYSENIIGHVFSIKVRKKIPYYN